MFSLDLTKRFPNLGAAAPIVEAAINWQCKADCPWQPDELRTSLSSELRDYPKVTEVEAMGFGIKTRVGAAPEFKTNLGWKGFRLETADKGFVAVFRPDGLVVSRLYPYQDWQHFINEASRLWTLYQRLRQPTEILRIGVRFINRLKSAVPATLSNYLAHPPTCPAGIPLSTFFYKSSFDVPGHSLGVQVTKAMQAEISGLVLDIDVFTRDPIPCEDALSNDRLTKMRSLKNLMFFELLSPEAIKTLEDSKHVAGDDDARA